MVVKEILFYQNLVNESLYENGNHTLNKRAKYLPTIAVMADFYVIINEGVYRIVQDFYVGDDQMER